MLYLLDITRARMRAFDKKQPESIIEEQLQIKRYQFNYRATFCLLVHSVFVVHGYAPTSLRVCSNFQIQMWIKLVAYL